MSEVRKMKIPECYDPAVQEASNALAYTVRVLRRPRCILCELPITTEKYLDLTDFGINGLSCERCMERSSHWSEDLDEP